MHIHSNNETDKRINVSRVLILVGVGLVNSRNGAGRQYTTPTATTSASLVLEHVDLELALECADSDSSGDRRVGTIRRKASLLNACIPTRLFTVAFANCGQFSRVRVRCERGIRLPVGGAPSFGAS